jgi:two-component system, cell cycle sensor histidine kinase and response regulator CckA
VYGVVRQSGGSIYVYSEPGHGTSFKLYLPRVDAEATAESTGAAAAAPTGAEVILLVEDEAPVRAFAERILSGLGYTLLEAANGEEGLEVAAAHDGPIDLLLTDVTMPGMQGPQLAAVLRKVRPEVRIMYISGFTETLVGRPGSDGDGSTFLPKPFAGESLARAVREALDRAS